MSCFVSCSCPVVSNKNNATDCNSTCFSKIHHCLFDLFHHYSPLTRQLIPQIINFVILNLNNLEYFLYSEWIMEDIQMHLKLEHNNSKQLLPNCPTCSLYGITSEQKALETISYIFKKHHDAVNQIKSNKININNNKTLSYYNINTKQNVRSSCLKVLFCRAVSIELTNIINKGLLETSTENEQLFTSMYLKIMNIKLEVQ